MDTTSAQVLTDYFDTCRRKRNNIDYDTAEVVSESEASDLLEKAREFKALIEVWIAQNYPTYL